MPCLCNCYFGVKVKILKFGCASILISLAVLLIGFLWIREEYFQPISKIVTFSSERYGGNFLSFLERCDTAPKILKDDVVARQGYPCFVTYISESSAKNLGLSNGALGGASRFFETPGIVLVPSRLLPYDLATKSRILIHETQHLMDYKNEPDLTFLELEMRAWGVSIPLFISDVESGYYPLSIEDLKEGKCIDSVSQTECYLAAKLISGGEDSMNEAIREIYGD